MNDIPLIAEVAAMAVSIARFQLDVARERRIVGAIAPALIGDLNGVPPVLKDVKHSALRLQQNEIAHHYEIERTLRSVARIRLSAFDRLNDMLPLLGKRSAHIVIDCYTMLVSTVALARDELEANPSAHQLKLALITVATDIDQLSQRVDDAQAHLRKYAS
jgi:hypothetical protein